MSIVSLVIVAGPGTIWHPFEFPFEFASRARETLIFQFCPRAPRTNDARDAPEAPHTLVVEDRADTSSHGRVIHRRRTI